jgi:hypothetical protein
MAEQPPFRHPYAKQAGAFAIVVGIAMLAIWAYLLATGDTESLETTALGAALHIAGELVTAIVLIAAGWGLIAAKPWSERAFILANGMLLIAVIHAVAWYGDRGDLALVVFFVLVAIAAVFFVIRAEE